MAQGLGVNMEQICNGLESATSVEGRLKSIRGLSEINLFDDTYNANPKSVKAAADFLSTQKGKKFFVLGDMAELGDSSVFIHAEVGSIIKESGIDYLFGVGELTRNSVDTFGDGAYWFESIEDLIKKSKILVAEGDSVLVKGSRSMRMERVVSGLLRAFDNSVFDRNI